MVQQNARISMTLSGLPEDVKSIGVTVSPIYTTLELNGELSGSGAKSFELKKENDTWTASEVMVYPSVGSTTTFTLTITSDTEQKSYSYVYGKPLERNKPYNFVGNYQGGNDAFDVTGLIYMEDWGEVETVEFDFGPNAEGAQQNVNGHLAITEDLYLSLMEWTDVVSAANEGNPKQAVEIAAEYTEGGLTGWRIPTAEEAKEFDEISGTVSIGIPYASTELFNAEVLSVNREGSTGNAVVVLECKSMDKTLAKIRNEQINISVREYSGIKIEKSSIHRDKVTRTIENQDGTSKTEERMVDGVYILYGNELRFKEIVKIYETDDFVFHLKL